MSTQPTELPSFDEMMKMCTDFNQLVHDLVKRVEVLEEQVDELIGRTSLLP